MPLSADTASMHLGKSGLTTTQPLNPMRKGDRVFSPYSGLNPSWDRYVQPRTTTSIRSATRIQSDFHEYQRNPAINQYYAQGLLLPQPSGTSHDAFRRKESQPVNLALLPGDNRLQLRQRLQQPDSIRISTIISVLRPTPPSEETGSTVASEGVGHEGWTEGSVPSDSREGSFNTVRKAIRSVSPTLLSNENLLQTPAITAPYIRKPVAETRVTTQISHDAFRKQGPRPTTPPQLAFVSPLRWDACTKPSVSRRTSEVFEAQWKEKLAQEAIEIEAFTCELLRDPIRALHALHEDNRTTVSPFTILHWERKVLSNPAFMKEFMDNPNFRHIILAKPSFIEAMAVRPKVVETFVSRVPQLARELIANPIFMQKLQWSSAGDLFEHPAVREALAANPKAFIQLIGNEDGSTETMDEVLARNDSLLRAVIKHPAFVPAVLEAKPSTIRYLCWQGDIMRELSIQWEVAGKLMQHPLLATAILESSSFSEALIATPQLALNLLDSPGFVTALARGFCSTPGQYADFEYPKAIVFKLLAYEESGNYRQAEKFEKALAKELLSPPFTDSVSRYYRNRNLKANSQFIRNEMNYPYLSNVIRTKRDPRNPLTDYPQVESLPQKAHKFSPTPLFRQNSNGPRHEVQGVDCRNGD